MSASLQPLLHLLDGHEDEDRSLRVIGVSFPCARAVRIDLAVVGAPEDEPQLHHWRVIASDVREASIASEYASPLKLFSSHRLLHRYREPWAEVTFVGRPRSVLSVLGALWLAHSSWAREVSMPGSFFNARMSPADVLKGGYGQLASGPESLMHRFAGVLRRHEVRATVLPTPRACEVSTHAPLLLGLGESYIIASRFHAEPVAPAG